MTENNDSPGGTSVPDETPNEEQSQETNEIKNLKSEYGRKFENLSAQLAQLTSQLQQASEARQQPAQTQVKPIRELLYEDPDQAARLIKEEAVREAETRITGRFEKQQALQNKLMELSTEFPEFRDQNSDAFQKAREFYSTLPSGLKDTAEGAEIAMQRAALQLGLTPASKRRKSGSDDYVGSSTGSGSGRRNTSAKDEVAEDTKTFAAILANASGRDFNDPKLQEGLKQASKRKDWRRYSS